MEDERFKYDLFQGEEWKPQGIVGQIQPGAEDIALPVIITVRNLFLFKTNPGGCGDADGQ